MRRDPNLLDRGAYFKNMAESKKDRTIDLKPGMTVRVYQKIKELNTF